VKLVRTEAVLARLEQLVAEVSMPEWLHYHDRLRELKHYCEVTPALAGCLAQLPQAEFDFSADWRDWQQLWPTAEAGYAYRWDAVNKVVASGDCDLITLGPLSSSQGTESSLDSFTKMFVYPLYHYLVSEVQSSAGILYALLRYKRWAEWFEAGALRGIYDDQGEEGLDRSLRRFLFESGIDYPFSEPRSPGGRADIVAELDTDDPLVLEIKTWDANKGYGEDRVRDGLRQVIDYADKYGKDNGYVAVFNLDTEPLAFLGDPATQDWPSRLERGGKTYHFIPIEIAEQREPVSQRARGKPVGVNEVRLVELWVDGTRGSVADPPSG
jgi:hypothetical protein